MNIHDVFQLDIQYPDREAYQADLLVSYYLIDDLSEYQL